MCNGANCMHKMKPAQTRSGLRQPTGQNQISLRLRAPFGSNCLVEPDDILDTKLALMALDYYQPVAGTQPGAFVDNDLFAGIKSFQRDHGLKVDGLLRPGGETETTLNAALRHADPSRPIPDGEGTNDNQPPANENQPGWDEARRPGRPGGGGGSGGTSRGKCEAALGIDSAKCAEVGQRLGRQPQAICMRTAMDRYGHCLANKKTPPPPLADFNWDNPW